MRDWRLWIAAALIVAGAVSLAWFGSITRPTVIITSAPIMQEPR